ncbi:serine hydrolase domain-containing protein [Oscillibacter sp.]|uniref:serine hydrolase domain-containing protein n=1 Tax=Oscillibacter sp. TaxID=1945593 RepID=UPI0028AED34E|nr:serine hydrolase domain-containing protein [Oscillibacter sp.]
MNCTFKKQLGGTFLAFALTTSLMLPTAAASSSLSTERQAADSAAVETAQKYGLADSISYALWDEGKLSYTAVLGGDKTPATESLPTFASTRRDLYGIGSISKIYTTVAVMKLVEAGKINLDSPVTNYLKDFKMADSRYTKITVRMLLNHSSGLAGTSSVNAFLFDDDDQQATDELLQRLSTQKLRADPGAFSAYCNDGFTLAELIVEAVSGKDFMDYVRAEILSPLRLNNTFAPQDSFSKSLLAPTYASAGDSRELPAESLGVVGAGGLYATATDLASFGGALTGTTLLSSKSTAAMAAPEYDRGIWPDEPLGLVSFGLGWDAVEFAPFAQNGIQCLVKGGDTLRYHAALLVLPEYNLAAAVVSAGGVSVYNELAAAQLLISALKEKGVEVDETVPTLPAATVSAMPQPLVKESGYYGTTKQQVQITVSSDGKLLLHQVTLAGVPDQTLTYYSDGSFRDESNTVAVKLARESNGYTYFYQQDYTPLPGLGVLPTSDYLMVKMPENSVSAEAQAAWDALLSESAVPLAEKYTSQLYLALSDSAQSAAAQGGTKSVPGYVGGYRIASPTELVYDLPIGRDANNMTVEGKVLWIGSAPYLMDRGIKNLFTGTSASYSTIQPDGYARWYTVGEKDAGKTMTVTLPENAGFYVYDAEGTAIASSLLWGDRSVKLPKGGMVVFSGDAGARFHLSFAS